MEHRRQKKMSWMFNVQRETIKRSEIKRQTTSYALIPQEELSCHAFSFTAAETSALSVVIIYLLIICSSEYISIPPTAY